MKVCVAQSEPIKGDIQGNIENHKQFIELAAANGAEMIVFPELSLTGYEPSLAKGLAVDQENGRFHPLQTLSDTHQIIIGVGVPTKSDAGICISMIIFQPHQAPQSYSKKHLHVDEEPFFVSGQNFPSLTIGKSNVAIAICYELSVPEHAELAFQHGADIYIASVAKSASGVRNANKRLAAIAKRYGMTVLMANCVGPCEGFDGGGKTAVWHSNGQLLAQLNDTDEGLIIYDTATEDLLLIKPNKQVIRRSQSDDALEISQLVVQNLRQVNSLDYPSEAINKLVQSYTPEKIIERAQSQYVLVCTLENRLIGTATLDANRVRNVFVHVDWHRKGIGQYLMAAIEAHARRQQLPKIFLLSGLSACQFYETLGYEVVERFESDLDSISLPVIKMEKTISSE